MLESIYIYDTTPTCLGQRHDREADGRVHIVELEEEVGALRGAQPKVAGDCAEAPNVG